MCRAGHDAGLQFGGHRLRHRRDHDPPAAGSMRDHLAVQLPRHDNVLVPALRAGLRQHSDREAVRAGAADHAESFSTGGDAGAAAGRVEPGERRARCGQRHSGSEDRARGKLRGIERHGAVRVRAGGRHGQAGAMPGRGEKSGNPAAGCGSEVVQQSIADSAFGCAGQRCLASSLAITVGEAAKPFMEAIEAKAAGRTPATGWTRPWRWGR